MADLNSHSLVIRSGASLVCVTPMLRFGRSSAFAIAILLVSAACSGSSETDQSAITEPDSTVDTPVDADADSGSADDAASTTVTTAPPETTAPTTTQPPATQPTTTSSVADPAEDSEAVDFSQPSDDPLIESITQRYVDQTGIGDPQATEAEFRCVSTRLIEDVGLRTILEASVSDSGESDFDPSTLDEADQDVVVDAMSTCLDLEAMFEADLIADGTMTEDQAACLADEITDRGLFEQLIGPIVLGQSTGSDGPDAETQAAISEAALGCIDLVEQMAAEFAADGTLSEASARCLAEGMDTEGLLETLLSEALTDDAEPSDDVANQAAFIEIARGCLTAEEFTAISE